MLKGFEEINYKKVPVDPIPKVTITKSYFYFNKASLVLLNYAPKVRVFISKTQRKIAIMPSDDGINFYEPSEKSGFISRLGNTYSYLFNTSMLEKSMVLPCRIEGYFDKDENVLIFDLPSHL